MREAGRFARKYRFWACVAILAAASAISHAEENWISLFVVAAAIVVGIILAAFGKTLASHTRTPLGLVTVVLFTLDFLYYSRGVILTIAHLMIMTAAIYLVSSRVWKDWAWLFVQGLVLLAAAGAATFEPAFAAYSAVFAFSAAMFGYNALASQAADGPWRVVLNAPGRFGRRAAFASVSVLALASLTVGLYFAVPRFRPFGFTTPIIIRTGRPIAGFSQDVSLDSGVGVILNNSSLVFRARVEIENVIGEVPINLYWRGVTLTYFTGTGWRKQATGAPTWSTLLMPGWIVAQERALGSMVVKQEIALERLSADTVFALPGVTEMNSSAVAAMRLDKDTGDLARLESAQRPGPYVYAAISSPVFHDESDLANTGYDYDVDDEEIAAALDDSRVSPEARALASRIAGSLATPYERAVAIENYLRQNYDYTTELAPASIGETPIDTFLFRAGEGHCELFSSAMALMLRTLNVPTRVVNGFLNGEYNPVGGYYYVQQLHAHSWTEVYFNGRGWFTFDATPAGQGGEAARQATFLGAIVDYMKYRWLGAMAAYNAESQGRIFSRIGETLAPAAAPLGWTYDRLTGLIEGGDASRPSSSTAVLGVILTAIFAVAAAFVASALFGGLKTAGKAAKRRLLARSYPYPPFYRAFLGRLKKDGLVRRIDETPRELAERAAGRRVISDEAAHDIIDGYYKTRFAGLALSQEENDRLERLSNADREN